MKKYNVKRIETANYEEIYIKNKIDRVPGTSKKNSNKRRRRRKKSELSLLEQRSAAKQRQRYYKNKRFEISRIIDCNLDYQTKFITLTFKDTKEFDITNYEATKKEFDKFIKRLRRYLEKEQPGYKLKYLAVHEIQEERKAYHFHIIIFGMNYIPNVKFGNIWGLGFVKINKISDELFSQNKVGLYVSKYFWKEDNNIKNQNKYFSSRNLRKPVISHELISSESREQFIKNKKNNIKAEQVKTYKYKRPKFSRERGEEIEEVEVVYIRLKK